MNKHFFNNTYKQNPNKRETPKNGAGGAEGERKGK